MVLIGTRNSRFARNSAITYPFNISRSRGQSLDKTHSCPRAEAMKSTDTYFPLCICICLCVCMLVCDSKLATDCIGV